MAPSLRNGLTGLSLTSSLPHVQVRSMTVTRDPAHGGEQTVAKLAGTQITETISTFDNATFNHGPCLADNDILAATFRSSSQMDPTLVP